MQIQQTLFDDVTPRYTGAIVKSISYDEAQIIRDALRLRGIARIDLDPCFSIGRIWRDLPAPRFRFDLNPQPALDARASVCEIPLADASIDSVFFDPPFLVRGGGGGKMQDRFTAFDSKDALYAFVDVALLELARVMCPRGVLLVKCQNSLHGGKQIWFVQRVLAAARAADFELEDEQIYIQDNVLISPNVYAHQQHARKIHSFFLTFIRRNCQRRGGD